MSRQTITRTQYTLGVVYGFLGGWASLDLYRAWRTGWRPWQWEALIVPLIWSGGGYFRDVVDALAATSAAAGRAAIAVKRKGGHDGLLCWLLVVKLIGPAAVPESHQAQLHLASRRACLL